MKKLFTLAVLAMIVAMAGNAMAVIGWAGNVWPNSGANVTPVSPVDVYAQVWKAGVTDAAGQGADIMADMVITNDIGGSDFATLTYLGDVGSNDEYTAQIPVSMLVGASWVEIDITFLDLSDGTGFYPVADQAGNPGPQRYNVINVLPNDVDVSFQICLSGAGTMGDVCVIGSAAEIGAWGTGVNLTNVSGDLWEGTVTFLAGSNPYFEYKYKKDGCATWEGAPNRPVTLPTDGTTAVALPADSWDNLPMGCGMGTTLEEDKVVCIQVCLSETTTTGGVCVTGGLAELTNWGNGMPMTMIGPSLYQACLVFSAGQPIPLSFEFKFRKDGCETWESVANRSFTVDNSLPYESLVTYGWDDGGINCGPVDTEDSSWGSLKSMFR
ncbi:MAG: carbohydrate-binding module family 20 domain-containing protein [bacterium]